LGFILWGFWWLLIPVHFLSPNFAEFKHSITKLSILLEKVGFLPVFGVEPLCGTLFRELVPAQRAALTPGIPVVTRCAELAFPLGTSERCPGSLHTVGTLGACHPEIREVSQKELSKLCCAPVEYIEQFSLEKSEVHLTTLSNTLL